MYIPDYYCTRTDFAVPYILVVRITYHPCLCLLVSCRVHVLVRACVRARSHACAARRAAPGGGRVRRESTLPGLADWIEVVDYRIRAIDAMDNVIARQRIDHSLRQLAGRTVPPHPLDAVV